jgi:DNA-binding PadR family transcriptional regulator
MRHNCFGHFFAAPGPGGGSRSRGWSGPPFHHWFSQMMGPGPRAERGEVRYLILDALSDEARHGYDVIREIEKRSDGLYKPSPGAVYPTLQMLEEMGLIGSREEGGRKLYELTDKGRQELEEHQEEVEEAYERICGQSPFFHEEHFQAMGKQVSRMFRSMRRSFQQGRIESGKMGEICHVLEEAVDRIEEILK